MKKNIFITLALCSAFVVSCKKEAFNDGSGKENGDGRGEYTYTIRGIIDGDEDSKLGIKTDNASKYCGKWDAGDKVVIYQVVTGDDPVKRMRITNAPVQIESIGTNDEGKSVADISFSSSFPPETKCRVFYNSSSVSNVNVYGKCKLPSEQKQKGTGLENTSLKEYAFLYTPSDGTIQSKMKDGCTFKHAMSYVKIKFCSKDFKGWKVEEIVLKKDNSNSSHPLCAEECEFDCSVNPGYNETPGRASSLAHTFKTHSWQVSLTFEDNVTLTENSQEAWIVALPTYRTNEKIDDKPADESQKHYVYFKLSKGDAVEYAKVKFNTVLHGGTIRPLNVGEIVVGDIMNNRELYDEGFDIKIGDLTVNKTTYPTVAKDAAPSEISASDLQGGGLIFIDDKEGGGTVNLGNEVTLPNDLVLMGKYRRTGKQTTINGGNISVSGNAAFYNLKFDCNETALFKQKSGSGSNGMLRIADCYINMSGQSAEAVVVDRATDGTEVAAPYSKVYIDNCVIKLPSNEDNRLSTTCAVYLHKNSVDSDIDRTVDIVNNVIFTEYLSLRSNGVAFVRGNDPSTGTKSPQLSVNFSSNTIANIAAEYGVLYYHTFKSGVLPVKSFVANNNLSYFEECTGLKYTYAKFSQSTKPKDKGTDFEVSTVAAGGNWLGCKNATNNEGESVEYDDWNVENGSTNVVKQTYDPFTAKDYVNGYFPVNTAVVTNGAGASYDTKGYFNWTETNNLQ